MINIKSFIEYLNRKMKISFYTGVPDSILKNFINYIIDFADPRMHIITANEGLSISLASGYYIATRKIPVVYMQNSGIGNAVNPLLSLADKKIYSIPILLIIGWRGEPRIKDEPQHMKQGRCTKELLEVLGIPYYILSAENEKNFPPVIDKLNSSLRKTKNPHALLIKKNTFSDHAFKSVPKSPVSDLTREKAIELLAKNLANGSFIVSTTGKTSRELFEQREMLKQKHDHDFLSVGSMGHANHLALGIALNTSKSKVVCFDGDGALLMHLGSLPIIGTIKPKNFIHILFNNGSHDSVGGQPTVGFDIDFCKIAEASGYISTILIQNEIELKKLLKSFDLIPGPSFIEIRLLKGSRMNLGRPSGNPRNNLINFMNAIKLNESKD